MAKFLIFDDKVIHLLAGEDKPTGGAAVQAYGWIQGLLALGQQVVVLTDSGYEEVIAEKYPEIALTPSYNPDYGIRWIRWLYYRVPFLYNSFKKIKPDFIYKPIPSWHSFIIGLLCKALNIKLIQRVSNDNLVDRRILKTHSGLHWKFLRLGYKLSYCILCQNDYQQHSIRAMFPGLLSIKMGNPIILDARYRDDSAGAREYIAWLGIFQYQKNLKLLYQIAEKMPWQKFLIAGTLSENADKETLTYLDMLKKLENVEFAGFVPRQKVHGFLSKARFLLNTSRYEGFSNTFLEAMAAGTPILAHENVNPDGIISRYNLGIIYHDAEGLVRELEATLPGQIKLYEENALRYVHQYHGHISLTETLLAHLKVAIPAKASCHQVA